MCRICTSNVSCGSDEKVSGAPGGAFVRVGTSPFGGVTNYVF